MNYALIFVCAAIGLGNATTLAHFNLGIAIVYTVIGAGVGFIATKFFDC